jgi:hypothetical protein
MSTLLIKTTPQSSLLLTELVKQLGGDVIAIKDEQFEDLLLGIMMDSVKTGQTVSKQSIMRKLKSK